MDRVQRRDFLHTVGALLAAPLAVEAQQQAAKIARIGYLAPNPAHRAADEVRAGDQPQTAKDLGLTIPQSVIARADEVIQ